jgi:hypothetical protein
MMTYVEIAKELKCSRELIRQIEISALKKLATISEAKILLLEYIDLGEQQNNWDTIDLLALERSDIYVQMRKYAREKRRASPQKRKRRNYEGM